MTRTIYADGVKKEILQDIYGKIKPHHFLFYGVSGHGKSIASECVAEKLHQKGFLVIVITEKFKNRLEYAFCQFLAEVEHHVKYLEDQGKPQAKKNAIIYALYVDNDKYVNKEDPSKKYWDKNIPPMKFFTIDIKNDVTIKLWKILFDTVKTTESILAVISCQKELTDNEGCMDLARRCKEKIRKKQLKGTQQNIDEINAVFEEAFELGILQPANCKYNYKPDDLLLDQKNYHIFHYGFLPGDSYRKHEYFAVNCIMQRTIQRYNQLKKFPKYSNKLFPVLWVIQEINIFIPNKPNDDYIRMSVEIMEENIKQLRSPGHSSLGDAQNIYRTSEGYTESVTDEYLGKLSKMDVERFSKTAGYNQEQRDRLRNMPQNHYWKGSKGSRDMEKVILFPGHRHCEPRKEYFSTFAKEYPDKLRKHKEVHEYMSELSKKQKERHEEYMKELHIKKKEKDKEKKIKEIEKLAKTEEEKEELKEKLKETEKKHDKELFIKIYLESKLNPDNEKGKSWVQLGKDNEISDKTAKDYAKQGRDLVK